jgi:hypothetical protein
VGQVLYCNSQVLEYILLCAAPFPQVPEVPTLPTCQLLSAPIPNSQSPEPLPRITPVASLLPRRIYGVHLPRWSGASSPLELTTLAGRKKKLKIKKNTLTLRMRTYRPTVRLLLLFFCSPSLLLLQFSVQGFFFSLEGGLVVRSSQGHIYPLHPPNPPSGLPFP